MPTTYRVHLQDIRHFHVDVQAASGTDALRRIRVAIDNGSLAPVEDEEKNEGYQPLTAWPIPFDQSDLAT